MESTGHDLKKGFLGIFCNFDLSGVKATKIYIFNLRKELHLPLTFISLNINYAHYTICQIQKQIQIQRLQFLLQKSSMKLYRLLPIGKDIFWN